MGEVPEAVRKHYFFGWGCIGRACNDQDHVAKLTKAGFCGIGIEPTRVYDIEELARLESEGRIVDAIAPGGREVHQRICCAEKPSILLCSGCWLCG